MEYFETKEKLNFYICDSTLRDGEQVAGIQYTPRQKMDIARKLNDMGIESMDVGFAATSEEERTCIRAICDMKLDMRIMSMCRVVKRDLDYALECGVDGVILFIPGSDIHIKAKFEGGIVENREKLVKDSVELIKYAKEKGLFVEFGVEDSSRTDTNVLIDIFKQAEEAGADALGTTDTIGYFTPERMYQFIKKMTEHLHTPIGVHCHNDLGLATANTIAGLLAGGGYISPTVNGYGERAGNAALEEVLMVLKVLYHQDLNYHLEHLSELSAMVQKYAGIQNSIFKPVVGDNAYSHESGIHIHGMLKDEKTYEVFDPAMVSRHRKYVMGKHAGKHLIQHILNEAGFDATDEEAEQLWKKMKQKESEEQHYTEQDVIREYSKETK